VNVNALSHSSGKEPKSRKKHSTETNGHLPADNTSILSYESGVSAESSPSHSHHTPHTSSPLSSPSQVSLEDPGSSELSQSDLAVNDSIATLNEQSPTADEPVPEPDEDTHYTEPVITDPGHFEPIIEAVEFTNSEPVEFSYGLEEAVLSKECNSPSPVVADTDTVNTIIEPSVDVPGLDSAASEEQYNEDPILTEQSSPPAQTESPSPHPVLDLWDNSYYTPEQSAFDTVNTESTANDENNTYHQFEENFKDSILPPEVVFDTGHLPIGAERFEDDALLVPDDVELNRPPSTEVIMEALVTSDKEVSFEKSLSAEVKQASPIPVLDTNPFMQDENTNPFIGDPVEPIEPGSVLSHDTLVESDDSSESSLDWGVRSSRDGTPVRKGTNPFMDSYEEESYLRSRHATNPFSDEDSSVPPPARPTVFHIPPPPTKTKDSNPFHSDEDITPLAAENKPGFSTQSDIEESIDTPTTINKYLPSIIESQTGQFSNETTPSISPVSFRTDVSPDTASTISSQELSSLDFEQVSFPIFLPNAANLCPTEDHFGAEVRGIIMCYCHNV